MRLAQKFPFLMAAMLCLAYFFALVYADTNGIWINSEDIRGETFGFDEQNFSGSFTFINPLTINSTFTVNGNASINGTVETSRLLADNLRNVSCGNMSYLRGFDENGDIICEEIEFPEPEVPEADETSCYSILESGGSSGSGYYTIDPDGEGGVEPFEVYCDMSSDGGGWALAVNEPAGGVYSLIPIAVPVRPEQRGRLQDEQMHALLEAASNQSTNNVKIKVSTWVFSMRVTDGTKKTQHIGNVACTGYTEGPTDASSSESTDWSIFNGATGGTVGYHDVITSHPNPSINGPLNFRINLCGWTDRACGAGYGGGCANRQNGEIWIR